MLNRKDIVDRLIEGIQSGIRYDDPYPMCTFRPFSTDLYERILAHLPPTELYSELRHPDAIRSDGTCARLVFPLQGDRIRALLEGDTGAFWLDFSEALKDDRLATAFKKLFESELTMRFDRPLLDVPAHPVPMLIRDFGGYRIRIHHDIDTKVITTQYYLPSNEDQRHLGTRVYRRLETGEFSRVRNLEFLPGVAYAFAVSRRSWHAVETMADTEQPRNSLMLIYYRVLGIDY